MTTDASSGASTSALRVPAAGTINVSIRSDDHHTLTVLVGNSPEPDRFNAPGTSMTRRPSESVNDTVPSAPVRVSVVTPSLTVTTPGDTPGGVVVPVVGTESPLGVVAHVVHTSPMSSSSSPGVGAAG